jgi:serine/threonine-protein kinase/endoribonuclease IRE1
MPPEKEVCLQLAMGLAHIHEKGFIYWDFKPQNVLIHPTGGKVLMKWADFGLSKPQNDRGSISTTEHNKRPDDWFAPEILIIKNNMDRTTPIRQEGTVMSDVFSTGLIFGYYLLKGRHPYGFNFNIPTNIIKNTPDNLTGRRPIHIPFLNLIGFNNE